MRFCYSSNGKRYASTSAESTRAKHIVITENLGGEDDKEAVKRVVLCHVYYKLIHFTRHYAAY
jgi:hypothetical protein